MEIRVNLGCPNFCQGWICVDLHPHDSRVIESDAVSFLWRYGHNCVKLAGTPREQIDHIKAFNLLEHLPDVGFFFRSAHGALKIGATMIIRTDYGAWLPFYVPLFHRLGWGAHASEKYYPAIMNTTQHFALFSPLHLRNYARLYGFDVVAIKKVTFGARLLATFRKVSLPKALA